MISFNKGMNACRESVEHVNSMLKSRFAFINFDKKLKLLESPVSSIVLCTILLTNCYTCLEGSQVGEYFDMREPQLEQYLKL